MGSSPIRIFSCIKLSWTLSSPTPACSMRRVRVLTPSTFVFPLLFPCIISLTPTPLCSPRHSPVLHYSHSSVPGSPQLLLLRRRAGTRDRVEPLHLLGGWVRTVRLAAEGTALPVDATIGLCSRKRHHLSIRLSSLRVVGLRWGRQHARVAMCVHSSGHVSGHA